MSNQYNAYEENIIKIYLFRKIKKIDDSKLMYFEPSFDYLEHNNCKYYPLLKLVSEGNKIIYLAEIKTFDEETIASQIFTYPQAAIEYFKEQLLYYSNQTTDIYINVPITIREENVYESALNFLPPLFDFTFKGFVYTENEKEKVDYKISFINNDKTIEEMGIINNSESKIIGTIYSFNKRNCGNIFKFRMNNRR